MMAPSPAAMVVEVRQTQVTGIAIPVARPRIKALVGATAAETQRFHFGEAVI